MLDKKKPAILRLLAAGGITLFAATVRKRARITGYRQGLFRNVANHRAGVKHAFSHLLREVLAAREV